ncbi:MAG: type II and III secretion system protein, partial [Candidatus Omnitrophica bacterium]|nr:type II and III secretion system protein [Candidatus Omnitrophota bacterium]
GIIDEKRDFDALLNYIKNIGNVQILSNPKLVVTNNQEARLHIGERQAYITSTTTTGQTVSTVSEEVNFIDVGIQLAVTPTINDDGFITMKVKPEISSVIYWLVTPTGNKIPIIDTTLTETTVLVKNGVSVLIGGLRKQEKTKTSQQTPILGKIPFLGFFFRNQTEKMSRSEYLVMLTPHIISGDILLTGDEREDRGFREYLSYVPQEKEILSQIKPKSYRDYEGE